MYFDENYLICSLQNKVNSALLTYENHTQDNGFFEETPYKVIKSMNIKGYEPIGICKNVPFPCAASSMSIGFVFKYLEELYWVHMPETYWFVLLSNHYGREQAEVIADKALYSDGTLNEILHE